MQEPRQHLLDLGLSDSEVTVYLAMIAGARTARELLKITGLKRPTVYYALGCLEKRSLINRTGMEGDKHFNVQPLERLVAIAESKALESNKLKEDVIALLPSLAKNSPSENQKSHVAFFEGKQAVKHVIMDMLYCHSKQINSIAPQENFFWQIGADFVKLFVQERQKRRIKTRNLWEVPVEKKIIQQYYQGLSEVRILPEIMKNKFRTTIFLYDDKTLYISSASNSYCLLITSQELNDTMQAMFDGLWIAAEKHQ